MTSPETVLTQAEQMLVSERPSGSRMAAWMTRTALESAVRGRLAARGHPVDRASMRSVLTCLSVLDPETAASADYTWRRLSQACHHHAFELSPTVSEVRHLIQRVRALAGCQQGANEERRHAQTGAPH